VLQAANEDADLINNPPVFGAPAADSDVDSDDMTRPRLAGGIGPADLAGPHAHAHDHAHGPASASRRYVSLADDCKWCDQQYQKDVKLLTAGREGNLEGVLRAIDEGASVEARDLMHMNWTVVRNRSAPRTCHGRGRVMCVCARICRRAWGSFNTAQRSRSRAAGVAGVRASACALAHMRSDARTHTRTYLRAHTHAHTRVRTRL